MWRQIGSLKTAGTNQKFLPKFISTSLPKVDLFTSRLSHQLPQYFAWKLDPCLILSALKKVSYDLTGKMLLVTPTWESQIWYLLLLEMSIVCPLLPRRNTSLKNPQVEVHSLITNRTLRGTVWAISGKDYLRTEFRKQLPTCYNN